MNTPSAALNYITYGSRKTCNLKTGSQIPPKGKLCFITGFASNKIVSPKKKFKMANTTDLRQHRQPLLAEAEEIQIMRNRHMCHRHYIDEEVMYLTLIATRIQSYLV